MKEFDDPFALFKCFEIRALMRLNLILHLIQAFLFLRHEAIEKFL